MSFARDAPNHNTTHPHAPPHRPQQHRQQTAESRKQKANEGDFSLKLLLTIHSTSTYYHIIPYHYQINEVMEDSQYNQKHQRRESVSKITSEYENLIPLTETQVSKLPFPPGCRVCFNHTNSSSVSKHIYDATEGVVMSASLWMDPSKSNSSFSTVYHVEVMDDQGGKSTLKILGENLAYSFGQAVYLQSDDGRKIEAEIGFSHKVVIDTRTGHTNLVYIVVSRNASRIQTEKGVKPCRVSYRQIEGDEVSQSKKPEENDEGARLNESDEKLPPQTGVVGGEKTELQVPEEIVSNQMDSLSEALTEFPETSNVPADMQTNIPIKEEDVNEVMEVQPLTDPLGRSLQVQIDKNETELKVIPTNNESASPPILEEASRISLMSSKDVKSANEMDSRPDIRRSDSNATSATNISERWQPPIQQDRNCTRRDFNPGDDISCTMIVPLWLHSSEGCGPIFREYLTLLLF